MIEQSPWPMAEVCTSAFSNSGPSDQAEHERGHRQVEVLHRIAEQAEDEHQPTLNMLLSIE